MQVLRQRTTGWLGLALAAAVLAAGCGGDDESDGGEPSAAGTGQEEQVQEVRLGLPFDESIAFIGFLVAQDRFFAEEGLEVETISTGGSGEINQQLIAGNIKFARGNTDVTMIANGQGRDVRQVALLGRGIFTIEAPEDSDVRSIEDLRGKAIGITDLAGGEVGLVSLALAEAGLEEGEDVELKVVGPGGPAAFDALQRGEIAAYAGATNDLAGMEAAGLRSRVILPEKLQGLPSNGLLAMQSTLENETDRQTLIKLGRAWLQGQQFALENPDEALRIACEAVPEECENEDNARAFLDRTLETVKPLPGAGPLENAPRERFEIVKQALLEAGDLKADIDIDQVFPNDYIQEMVQGSE